jgi:ketosteroid isomerase-like protein
VQRSADIEQLVRDWFAAASNGDPSLARAHVSREAGVRLIGSDPAEYLAGGDTIRDFLLREVEGGGGQAKFAPSEVEGFEEGSVGWATTKLTITLPDGGQISPRWSAVFHREDGGWRFVQTHASIGVGNDDIGWVYPGQE